MADSGASRLRSTLVRQAWHRIRSLKLESACQMRDRPRPALATSRCPAVRAWTGGPNCRVLPRAGSRIRLRAAGPCGAGPGATTSRAAMTTDAESAVGSVEQAWQDAVYIGGEFRRPAG